MEYSATQVHNLLCLHLVLWMSLCNVNYKGYEPTNKCTIESLSMRTYSERICTGRQTKSVCHTIVGLTPAHPKNWCIFGLVWMIVYIPS